MPTRVSKATAVLNRIVEFYLSSHDFNGIRANVLLGDTEPATNFDLLIRMLIGVPPPASA
jgi:hypothetical protein